MLKTQKKQIIESFRIHEGDTGSTEIHFGTQRGLLKLVGQRRRLLNYLSKENVDLYHQVISKLGLRK